MNTELLYMKYMQELVCSAVIMKTINLENKDVVILNQTVFYPQGGGQPYDTGIIKSEDNSFVFEVQEVRFVDGEVHHIGIVKTGKVAINMNVNCSVNKEIRELNTRLHSAGHMIDMSLKELKIDWVPGKGYHFPQGAYIEYLGNLDECDIEKLKQDITNKVEEIINRNIKTSLVFNQSKLQNGKPMRTVYYGSFGIFCGGTHVAKSSDIGKVNIRKIKKEKNMIRISYSLI